MEFNGTFLVTIISFLIFVFLMNKILYEPIGKIVSERHKFIDGNLQTADENNKKAEDISNKKEESLKNARNDVKGKYSDSINEFKSQKDSIVQNAQHEADEALWYACENLDKLSKEAKEALKNRMTELSNDITEKILGYRSDVQGFDNDTVDKILYE